MAEIEKESASVGTEEAKSLEQAGASATQAAVPGAETANDTKPTEPPMKGASEAEAVAGVVKDTGAASGVASLIGIEDFAKVELRAAQVLTAERVPKADKLLRLTVDLGEAASRQILAGIAQYYEPEKLVGRKIIVVANLQPRKMRGLESQGMLLAASIGDEGRPVLATFTEDVPNGAKLK
jgi:methionyl-tRNA synthetase